MVQKELNETVVRSREEIEERLETEDRQQLGDITDEVYPRDTPTPEFHLRVPRCTPLFLFLGAAKRHEKVKPPFVHGSSHVQRWERARGTNTVFLFGRFPFLAGRNFAFRSNPLSVNSGARAKANMGTGYRRVQSSKDNPV